MASLPDLIHVTKGRREASKLLLIGEVRNSSTLVRNKRKQLRNF